MSIQEDLEGPQIIRLFPAQDGQDNAGIGETAFGEKYLIKTDEKTCIAEFIGISTCKEIGIPTPEPKVVNLYNTPVFGSRMEFGCQSLPLDVTSLLPILNKAQKNIFSAVLAVDLALGNNDRHWGNWIYQTSQTDKSVTLRAIDFSRSWPIFHPPLNPIQMLGQNTHIAWGNWGMLGVTIDPNSIKIACDKMQSLSSDWLSGLLAPLPLSWKEKCDTPSLCEWWKNSWSNKVVETQTFIDSGAWK